jgi:hypothetical protein
LNNKWQDLKWYFLCWDLLLGYDEWRLRILVHVQCWTG